MIARAEIVAFDSGTHTATLRYAASRAGAVASVPVSAAIAAGDMVVGETVGVLLFGDGSNPLDALVVGVTAP
jgi:hypothetical protein